MRIILMMTLAWWLIGCSSMKVSSLNPETKRFATEHKATIILNKPIDLDMHNALLLMPKDNFLRGQMANIGYFKELITLDELRVQIIRAGLAEKVPSLSDAYGINKAAKFYKQFLWFRLGKRINLDGDYGQFILTNPKTFEDYFVAEIKLEDSLKGTGDNLVWYPLFNALIDYIEQNAKSWEKATKKVNIPKTKMPKNTKQNKKKPGISEFFSNLGTYLLKDNNVSKEHKKLKKVKQQTSSDTKTNLQNNTTSVNGVKNLFSAIEGLWDKPKTNKENTKKSSVPTVIQNSEVY